MTEKDAMMVLSKIAGSFAKELGYGKLYTWHEGIRYYLDDRNPNNIIWLRPDRQASKYILEIVHEGISAMLTVSRTDNGWAAWRMEATGDRGFQMISRMLSEFNDTKKE